MDHRLTEGSIRRNIIGFAVPVFIGYLFQQMYNTADSLIVGNYLGESALAAVSSNAAFIYLFVGFFMGFATGAGVVIARHIGANDPYHTSLAVHTTVAMGLAFSAIISASGVLLTPVVLRWMGTPPEVFTDSGKYLRIYTLEAWAEEEAKIDEYVDKAETNRDEARRSAREIYRSVADGELDAMGRTLVPMALREYAGIDDRMDMVIIGSGKFIEVWPEATWNEYYETEASKVDIGGAMDRIGIS